MLLGGAKDEHFSGCHSQLGLNQKLLTCGRAYFCTTVCQNASCKSSKFPSFFLSGRLPYEKWHVRKFLADCCTKVHMCASFWQTVVRKYACAKVFVFRLQSS